MILCIFFISGAAGILYTAYSLSKLDDHFDEVYGE